MRGLVVMVLMMKYEVDGAVVVTATSQMMLGGFVEAVIDGGHR